MTPMTKSPSVLPREKKYTLKEVEKVCRLFLQDMWNDQSEIQALSPKGKEIIWGGIFGKEITKHWLKIKKRLVYSSHTGENI